MPGWCHAPQASWTVAAHYESPRCNASILHALTPRPTRKRIHLRRTASRGPVGSRLVGTEIPLQVVALHVTGPPDSGWLVHPRRQSLVHTQHPDRAVALGMDFASPTQQTGVIPRTTTGATPQPWVKILRHTSNAAASRKTSRPFFARARASSHGWDARSSSHGTPAPVNARPRLIDSHIHPQDVSVHSQFRTTWLADAYDRHTNSTALRLQTPSPGDNVVHR